MPLPPGRKVVSCKWLCKHKLNDAGDVVRFKARLVARGFSQVYGMDYLDTFAPVTKLASIRILLAIAAVEDLEIHQMDVVMAFLLGDLDEEIYMEQPEGFTKVDDEGQQLVCKLNKGLYGLKQSARNWYKKLRGFLESIGFVRLYSDHCIYFNADTGVIIAVWVDDLIILAKEMKEMDCVKEQLRKQFEIKDLGELEYFLGIRVIRDRVNRRIHINQSGYINSVLERFGMLDSNPVANPIATGTVLKKATDNDALVEQQYYQSIVGSLMYAMLGTRPDIGYAESQLSQFNSNPNTTHLNIAKHVLKYLNGASDLGITYGDGTDKLLMEAYCDADHGTSEDRKSISGIVHILAGGPVSYQSKKQSSIATSSTEAEYMALLFATKETIWINRLLGKLGRVAENGNIIREDNQGAIALAHNPEYHARIKHIDIQYHFVRECVEKGLIELQYCSTKDMIADVLTKALARDRHRELISKMGMESIVQFKSGSVVAS